MDFVLIYDSVVGAAASYGAKKANWFDCISKYTQHTSTYTHTHTDTHTNTHRHSLTRG